MRYQFCSISCHFPSSFNNLKNHLLSKHLFLIYKTLTPRPPWSLGLQMMFHLVSLYFVLIARNQVFSLPFRYFKKESMNISKLVRTKLIRTSLSPYESNLLCQQLNFFLDWFSTGFQSLISKCL
jgi:hypothetical protein